jgi:hypothetical protein
MVKSRLMSKRAQIWGIDLVVAVVIFNVALLSFYVFTLNQSSDEKEKFESLSYHGRGITESILSDGYPSDWNPLNVVEIGILSENKINETKLETFYNFAQTKYSLTRMVFNTPYHYYFFLDVNMTFSSGSVDGIGRPGVDRYSVEAKNLIKIERVSVYQGRPVSAFLYIWEE